MTHTAAIKLVMIDAMIVNMSRVLVSISVEMKDTNKKSDVLMTAIRLVLLLVSTRRISAARDMGIINKLTKQAVAIEKIYVPTTTMIVKVKFLAKSLPSFEKLYMAKNIATIIKTNIASLPAVSKALSKVNAAVKSPVAKIPKSAMPTAPTSIRTNVFKNAEVSC